METLYRKIKYVFPMVLLFLVFPNFVWADQPEEGKRWSFDISGGWQTDDNVTETEDDNVSGKEDSAWVVDVSGEYKIFKKENWEIDVGYDFSQADYTHVSDFDSESHTGRVSASYDIGAWDFGLNYGYSYNILNNDEFLGFHSVVPTVGYFFRQDLYSVFYYGFVTKKFFQESERTGDTHNLGVSQFIFFNDYQAYVLLGYRINNEDTNGSEFDYLGHALSISFQHPLPLNSEVDLSYSYNLKDYENNTESIGTERRDEIQTVNLNITKQVIEHLDFKMDYSHTKSTSNLNSVDYSGNTVMIGLEMSY